MTPRNEHTIGIFIHRNGSVTRFEADTWRELLQMAIAKADDPFYTRSPIARVFTADEYGLQEHEIEGLREGAFKLGLLCEVCEERLAVSRGRQHALGLCAGCLEGEPDLEESGAETEQEDAR